MARVLGNGTPRYYSAFQNEEFGYYDYYECHSHLPGTVICRKGIKWLLTIIYTCELFINRVMFINIFVIFVIPYVITYGIVFLN